MTDVFDTEPFNKEQSKELLEKWRQTDFEDRGMGRYTLHLPHLLQAEWMEIHRLLNVQANTVTEKDMGLEPLDPEKMQRICLMFPSGIDMSIVEDWFIANKDDINEMLIRYKNFHGAKNEPRKD